ncbi:MAG: DUF6807 family protein [Verrucomicrobiota bacterium]
MKITIEDKQVRFISPGGTTAGCYVLDDPFKPYIHPLRTPGGHVVTDCMPVDHRHHKGLMFALRCEDLNFWEERQGNGQSGVQRSLSVEPVSTPDGEGIRQRLRWEEESGERPTYDEVRQISCREEPGQRAFLWTWSSRRTALRAHRLIKSEWSFALEDGRKINYHGLGIRLPWAWAFRGDSRNGAECDGVSRPWRDVCGTTGPEIGFWGKIDGHWQPPTAAVTLRQQQGFGWYVMKQDFAYLATGPSNLEELDVSEGRTFEETYQILVQDRP